MSQSTTETVADQPSGQSVGTALSVPARTGRRLMALLVGLAFVHGLLWAAMMPPWQVPDEEAYYSTAQRVAADAGLLAQPALVGWPARMPTDLYAWTAVPFVMAFKNPMHGMYALRVLGAFAGALVALLGFLVSRELFPEDRLIQWGTGLALAMLPALGQFFAYGSPDIHANLGGALLYWAGARTIMRGYRPVPILVAVGGTALAVAAKQSGYVLAAVLAVLPLFALARPSVRNGKRRRIEGAVVTILTVAGGTGAYAVVSRLVDGNSEALSAATAAVTPSAWLAALLGLAQDQPRRLLIYFWGRWGWDTGVELAAPWYPAFRVASLAAMAGLVLLAFRWWSERHTHPDSRARLATLGFFLVGAWASTLQAVEYAHIIGGWAHAHWLNPSIVPIMTLLVAGLAQWVPRKGWREGLLVLAGFLAAFDALALWTYVRPRFYDQFPAVLDKAANFVWLRDNPLAGNLVFGPRPFFALSPVTTIALQLLVWLCLAALVVRARGNGEERGKQP